MQCVCIGKGMCSNKRGMRPSEATGGPWEIFLGDVPGPYYEVTLLVGLGLESCVEHAETCEQ
eukprot:1839261-Prorocentrum_lima.AAC.1